MSILQQTFLKVLLERGKLDFQCPSEHGLFPDPLDCRKYYNCTNFNHVTVVCGSDLGFEPLAKSCVREESVPLCMKVQKLTGYTCNNTGLQVYENHCEKFILCTKEGVAFVSSCNRGDMFDQKWLLCLPENETNCSGSDKA
ncbi:unnamed protein product [Orchesella dallaii]|uniref:Chitin-binding type-2 domain-containing protein n=1 Tax=Orchesella dallaii TaxID=48710 RepID=A0ABP1QLN6_9HEXA